MEKSKLNELVADDLETCRVVLEMIAEIRERAEGHGQIKIEIADNVRTWWDYTIKHKRQSKRRD